MVEAPPNARALVTFGVSITDGATSTPDANHRWPDVLARRLVQADGAPVAVLNQGISGARVLSDRMGVNAWARFDRDVLSLPPCGHGDSDAGHQRYRLARHRTSQLLRQTTSSTAISS
jgi:hypothetical protein